MRDFFGMVAARADDADMRFLREIAANDEDALCRVAAERAVVALEEVPSDASGKVQSAGIAEPTPLVLEVLRTILRPAGFPVDLSPLRELVTADGEDLLTELLDTLLQQPRTPATIAGLREGTYRLRLVVAALTHDGVRAVTARLVGPVAVVTCADPVWAGGLLSLVRPRDVLLAVRRAVERPAHRLNVLRWLSESGSGLGEARIVAPGTPAPLPVLFKIFARAYPIRAATRGERSWADSKRADVASPAVRTAYPLLEGPKSVEPGDTFELRIGLSPELDSTLVASGPLRVTWAAFTLAVTLFHDGFAILGGSASTVVIEVTPEDPHPYAVMRLCAVVGPELQEFRMITAVFAAGGQPIGTASRQIRVAARAGQDEEAGTTVTTRSVEWSFDAGASRADVELYLARGADRDGRRWLWHVRSPHPEVAGDEEALVVDLDGTTAETIRRFISGIEQREGRFTLEYYLRTVAGRIGDLVHELIWDALRAASEAVGGPPTVLLVTEDAYIPWELARVPVPWTPDRPWLGAQAILGRWPYLGRRSAPAPLTAFEADKMAIVFGTYPDGIALPAAEAEGRALMAKYGATEVAPTIERILRTLAGEIPADVLHVALHGNFDAAGDQDGLLMIDGEEYLAPEDVEGVETSPVRLVFLNACQVAQGREVFGTYAGMAAALIKIGVSGLVAPLWKVDDVVAGRIADDFYTDIFTAVGSPASFLRRQRCGGIDDGESTPFAYVFFGHPLLAITWKG
ncbi:CHAT domain-containing protein [Amycolatopsis sp. NPDC051061]|uniref:CHAT domain-containing protein n=1 Tax=Amycolatopsis sp. NPDC051061 TaxID=3155042 RepID=UPI003422D2E1